MAYNACARALMKSLKSGLNASPIPFSLRIFLSLWFTINIFISVLLTFLLNFRKINIQVRVYVQQRIHTYWWINMYSREKIRSKIIIMQVCNIVEYCDEARNVNKVRVRILNEPMDCSSVAYPIHGNQMKHKSKLLHTKSFF